MFDLQSILNEALKEQSVTGAVAMIGYGDDSTGFDQWSAGLGLSF